MNGCCLAAPFCAASAALLALECYAHAATTSHKDPAQITVQVYNGANVPAAVLSMAEHEAGWILAKAGIDVTWLDCPLLDRKRGGDQICKQTGDPFLFVFSILQDAPAAAIEEFSLGFALPFSGAGNHAAAVFPNVASLAAEESIECSFVLAHVIAHEIGHLVLRSNRHGDGIMRVKWTPQDFSRMSQRSLCFTTRQIDELRRGLTLIAAQNLGRDTKGVRVGEGGEADRF